MGTLTLEQRIREFIGGIGWRIFIWASWHGNEETYFNSYEASEEAAGRLIRTPNPS